MARVRLCVCGSWFVGREGQAAHPRAPGQCLHFECRGAPARVRAWRCEGRPPCPTTLCVWRNLPYLTSSHGAWAVCRCGSGGGGSGDAASGGVLFGGADEDDAAEGGGVVPVSYTPLTLPTKRIV